MDERSKRSVKACIDLTALQDTLTLDEVHHLCSLAKEHRVASVCIKPKWVKFVQECLADSLIAVCTVANFPDGTQAASDVYQQVDALVKLGIDEIDVVAPKSADFSVIIPFLSNLRERTQNKVLKLIIESSQLEASLIKELCELAHDSKVDFIKTSTGVFGKADIESVRVILEHKRDMGLKISGGLKTFEDIKPYLNLLNVHKLPLDKTCFRIGSSTLLGDLIHTEGYK